MATRFEVVAHGNSPERLRAAAEEALDEVDRIEDLLSAFRPHSALARLNAEAGRSWVRVDPRLFSFLQRILALAAETDGAFDPTIGPLVQLWTEARVRQAIPEPPEIADALKGTGWRHVELDPAIQAVRFTRPGLRLDPGAVGKGHALDCAIEILREAGVNHALIHGGSSTVCALGSDPAGRPWTVALPDPPEGFGWRWPDGRAPIVPLKDTSLSVSAVWGRSFHHGGRIYGHVIDPRSGEPVQGAWLAAVQLPSALAGDALSTALLVSGARGLRRLEGRLPDVRAWLVESNGLPPCTLAPAAVH